MPFDPSQYRNALERAHGRALDWLAPIPARRVRPTATADELALTLPLPDGPPECFGLVPKLLRWGRGVAV